MNNLNIISKLDFKNTNVGNLTSLQDNNKYSNITWSGLNTPKIIEENNNKILKIDSNAARLESPVLYTGTSFSMNNFQVEFDIEFLSLKSENGYFGFTNSKAKWMAFYVRRGIKKGLIVTLSGIEISCNYLFESNKRYNIIVTRKDDIYSFLINGEIIGYTSSSEFSSKITSVNLTCTVGSAGNSGDVTYIDNAKIYGFNLSIGPTAKYDTQFTKYGSNLISKLNFSNIMLSSVSSSYTCGLESVINSSAVWEYTLVNPLFNKDMIINNTSYKTVLDNNFTIVSSMYNTNKSETINLVNINDKYKVLYTLIKTGAPEPEVIENEYTTSALDFENGIIDNVATTVWTKVGTANVTQNKIFGNASFETKALGDSLSTNSKLISGGSVPFTIEFYGLIKGRVSGVDATSVYYPLFTKSDSSPSGSQFFCLTANLQPEFYRYSGISSNNTSTTFISPFKSRFNEIDKYTFTYDGSAMRFFVNDEMQGSFGISQGWNSNTNHPFKLLHTVGGNATTWQQSTFGLIDNINIFDGVATKVRDYDPYEENLVVDLSFDGENNSTKIVDNGSMKSKWLVNSSAKLSTDQKFDGFSSLYTPDINSYIKSNDLNLNLAEDDYTFSFSFLSNLTSGWNIIFRMYGTSFRCVIDGSSRKMYTDLSADGTSRFTSNSVKEQQINKVVILFYKNSNYFDFYLNGVMTRMDINPAGTLIGTYFTIGRDNDYTSYNNGLNGYIKNFKIYKGVTIKPESPNGKIQLDFDNNVLDKYNNSTWTNNGVTFDQVNSVKGYSAKFNGSNSTYLVSTQNDNFNYGINNFNLSMDFNTLNNNRQYCFLLSTNTSNYVTNQTAQYGCAGTLKGLFFSKDNAVEVTTNINPVINQYYNTSISRRNSVFNLSLNDIVVGQYNMSPTSNIDLSYEGTRIGGIAWGSGFNHNGYIDNFKSYKEDLKSIIDNYSNVPPEYTTIVNNRLNLKVTNLKENIFKFKDCPSIKNFKAVIKLKNLSGLDQVLFRTTYWSTTNATFGYCFNIDNTTCGIGKGSNSSTGSWSWIIRNTVPKPSYTTYNDRTYEVKIVANESNMKCYIDDILYIDINDSTHLVAGQIGVRKYGEYSGDQESQVISIDIYDLNDVLIYRNNFDSKIENNITNTAVHLPLETNSNNIGFTPITVNAVGSPTYSVVDGKKCIKFDNGNYLSIVSNNIFNLGSSSDFYMEFDINVIAFRNGAGGGTDSSIVRVTGNWGTTSSAIQYNSNGNILLYGKGSKLYTTTSKITLNIFNKLIIKRSGNKTSIILNDEEETVYDFDFDFSINGTLIGGVGGSPYAYLNGYMSNFKMFVGTHQPPEEYNQNKVLDLDFKPTRKSYLFKDNNNKCIIHPVNITQRDYQDSKYCVYLDQTKYLQLGRNDLFNFGMDDFVIEYNINYDTVANIQTGGLLMGSNATSYSTGAVYFVIGSTYNANLVALGIYETNDIIMATKPLTNGNNKILLYRKDKVFHLKVNDEETIICTNNLNNYPINLNYNNNTFIGHAGWSTEFYKGYINSVKVLRNTTDLSLLENPEDVYELSEKFELTNGTDSQLIEYTELDNRELKIVNEDDKLTLHVNDDFIEVLKDDNIQSNVELYKDYKGNIKNINLYDIPIHEKDVFLGTELKDTEFGEISIEEDDEYYEIYNGDYLIKGFIEGYTDRKFNIIYENSIVFSGIEDYEYNNVNEIYIDEYFIHDLVTNEKYKVLNQEMIKGFISGTVNLKNCGVTSNNMEVFCYRSDNYRHIGTYSVDKDGKYVIPNLDVNSRYDIIFRDKTKKIKDQISNYRKPMKY